MSRTLVQNAAFVLTCLIALWAFAGFAASLGRTHRYVAPDKSSIVEVVETRRQARAAGYESLVTVLAEDGKALCTIDYASDDGEHGFAVAKAEWTPDSRFFVYSLTSSGGHQPWHTPTDFYDRIHGVLRSLDNYFPEGISKADFLLVAPNTVETEVWRGRPVPISVSLAALPAAQNSKATRPFVLNCQGGRAVKTERR